MGMGAAFDLAAALTRALVFIFALQAIGASLFLTRLAVDRAATFAGVRRLAAWSAGIAVVLVILRSVIEPMRMAGGLGGAVDPFLVRLFWESSVGFAQLARLAGLAICLVLCAARGSPSRLAAWLAAALVVTSFALTGHTRSHDGTGLLGALLVIHVFAAAYWFGSLLPLEIALRRETGRFLTGIVADFSRWAIWLVPAMLTAGLAIAWRLLGSFEPLLTPYGGLLLAKIAGFTVLAALGAVNRYRLTPALTLRPETAAPTLRRVIRLELAIMIAVLVVTAAMTTLYSPELPQP